MQSANNNSDCSSFACYSWAKLKHLFSQLGDVVGFTVVYMRFVCKMTFSWLGMILSVRAFGTINGGGGGGGEV